ncbi:hypothetical protein PQX77_013753 [Marasmius sp. AFHP31]|nr:hypothetical protein PQX77_013753 [Marasmius sp. AFHP31]
MDAFLSDEKKQKRKHEKERKLREKERDAAGIPHTDLTPFLLSGQQEQQQPMPPWAASPPTAPWATSSMNSGGDGESSIFSAASSGTVTARGRTDARANGGYETDATSGGRSKSRTGKLRKRSKSRAGKKGGDAGYETDDGYVSSSEKTLNKQKSKSRFFKLPNRSKNHVPDEDEKDPIPPPPPLPASSATQSPQAQFRLPIAARFATTLGNVNTGEALMEPPVTRSNSPDKEKRPLGNGSLDLGRPDSVDFSTAMSRAFASTSAGVNETSPTSTKPAPAVHFQIPRSQGQGQSQGSTSAPTSSYSASAAAAAPSSYHPAREASDASMRDSAYSGSGTSSSEHHGYGSSSASSSAFHSTSSHGTSASTSTAATSVVSSPSSPPTNLFSRFGSRRGHGDRKDKENEEQQQHQRAQISYPITRNVSPGPGPGSLSRQASPIPPTINTNGLGPTSTPPSAYSPASTPPSAPGSGRATPSGKGGHPPRPLFLHRVPSSEKGLGGYGGGGGSRGEVDLTHSPISPNYGAQSTDTNLKVKPTPSTLVIPRNPTPTSTSLLQPGMPSRSPSPSPSPIPSASYIVPSPSEPVFSATSTSPPSTSVSASAAPTSYNPLATLRRLRTRASEESLRVRESSATTTNVKGTTRTRVSEDTFNPAPPPQVFTIPPPATPPPSSPLPEVPLGTGTGEKRQASVFAAQQGQGQGQEQSYLRAPSPSPVSGSGSSSPSPSSSSPMRGRSSPFPAKPASPYGGARKFENETGGRSTMDLDGFGGRVKVRRYAELYGWHGNGNGQGEGDEDDTITTSTSNSSSRVPLRRDDEREWRDAQAQQRAVASNGRRDRDRDLDSEARRALPAGLHVPTRSESGRWRRHRPRQSTQVGINVEEPSDGEEDEGYGGEGEVFESEDDGARYYGDGARGGFSDGAHSLSGHGYDAPALDRRSSPEMLEKRSRNLMGRRRSEDEDEDGYGQSFSEDGHSRGAARAQRRYGLPTSPSPVPSMTRSRSRSEDDHVPVYQPQRQQRRGQQIPAPQSPGASDDSHYSANGRYTMYEDDGQESDYNARSTMYSEAPSFMDESRSRKARDRFLERVGGMYDESGREREPVPPIPSTYLTSSGRTSPNPGYTPTKSSMVNNRLAGLAGAGVGRGGRAISPVPPVPNLPKGSVVGIVGEGGEVVSSSKLWI